MIRSEHIRLLAIVGALIGLLLLTGERKRPIKLIVPFSAGGGSDTAGRMLEKALAESGSLDHPLVIINVPGGGGTIGSRRAKKARPDGFTLLLLHEGIFTAKQSGQAPYGAEGFTPVAAFGRTGTFVAVSTSSSHKDLRGLAQYSQQNPGKLTFACNLGAPAHFVGMQIEKAVEGKFRFVPSGGGAQRVEDLQGGEVECTIFSSSEFARFGKGGNLRALAYLGSERHPDFPDILTAKEQGFPLNAATTQFIWAPLGTPPDVVSNLVDGFRKALSAPEVVEQFKSLSMDPIFFEGDELLEQIADREKTIGAITVDTPAVFPYFPHIVASVCVLLAGFVIASGFRKQEHIGLYP